MNHREKDIERMFQKVNLYINRTIALDKEMKQDLRSAWKLFEEDNLSEQCIMDEEIARAKGIL